MKKAFCTGTLAVSLLLGAARAADLFLNTDTATGFLLSGSVWTRYWLMAPVVILAWLAGLYVPRKQPCGLRPGAGVWMSGVNFVFVPLAFCSELYGFLTVLNVLFGTPEQAGRHQTAERILLGQLADVTRAALFVVFGVWCLLVFFENRAREKRGGWMLYLGVAGSAAFYLHTVVRFVEQPASLYRILPAVEIFSALAALLFVTALLRALYLPGGVGTAPALSRCGLLAFFFCTCLALPQAVWQGMNGVDTPVSFPLAITLGCTGLLGAACARNIARRESRASLQGKVRAVRQMPKKWAAAAPAGACPERCRASCADAAPRARTLCAKMLFSFKMPRGVPQGRCRGVQSEAADEDCRARRRGPKDLFVSSSAEKQSFLTSWNWEV